MLNQLMGLDRDPVDLCAEYGSFSGWGGRALVILAIAAVTLFILRALYGAAMAGKSSTDWSGSRTLTGSLAFWAVLLVVSAVCSYGLWQFMGKRISSWACDGPPSIPGMVIFAAMPLVGFIVAFLISWVFMVLGTNPSQSSRS